MLQKTPTTPIAPRKKKQTMNARTRIEVGIFLQRPDVCRVNDSGHVEWLNGHDDHTIAAAHGCTAISVANLRQQLVGKLFTHKQPKPAPSETDELVLSVRLGAAEYDIAEMRKQHSDLRSAFDSLVKRLGG